MILYNVTVSIDPAAEQEWLNWMRQTHIPEIMETGCFIEARLSRVHGEEDGGVTYATSYVAETKEKLADYQQQHAPRLQKDHNDRFAGRYAAFRTMLSVIEEFRK